MLWFSLLSLLVSVFAMALSFYAFRTNHRTGIQPMLVFYSKGKNTKWHIKNVGNGPAINVLITGGDVHLRWQKEENVMLSAIPIGDERRLAWINSLGSLLAVYSDVYGNEYTSVCVHNRNKITGKNLFKDLKPKKYEWEFERGDLDPINVKEPIG